MKVLQSITFSSEAFIVEELLEQAPHRLLYKGYGKDSGQPVLIQHWPAAVLASPEAKERLDQEVTRFQQLAHPHILPVSKVLTQQRGLSLISPYPDQGSLQGRLSRYSFQPFPLNEACLILWQIGQALSSAHQHGFLHGTLTPGAIFFTEDHHAVVTGFRFQSILMALPKYHPKQEMRLPNTWYTAPEQFNSVLSEKSDQYALGCLAYALLTGHVPFPGYTHETLKRKHQSEPPQPLTGCDPQIPANIEDAVLMALAKQPENRHESMQDFLHALGAPMRQRTPSSQTLSTIDTALENRTGNVATWGMNFPPLRAISQGLSGNLSGIYDKNNPFAKMASIQGHSRPVRKGKRLYMPVLVLLVLIVVIIATMLTAFGISSNALHPVLVKTPVAGKGAHHLAPDPTPIIIRASPSPATPAPPTPTATPMPIINCHVAYIITSQTTSNSDSNNFFTASITITNTGNVSFNNWTLSFAFSDDDQFIDNITSGNASFSEGDNSEQVTITNAANDTVAAPAQSLTISIKGEWDKVNPVPPAFILNNNTLCH